MTKYIHYGSNEFNLDKFERVKNRHDMPFEKPDGGLWASPVNSRNSWNDWCLNNDYYVDALSESFVFRLKPKSKIFTIKTLRDIDTILRITTPLFNQEPWSHLDFESLLRLGYDAILVYMDDADVYYRLYGWDVDSLLVLNPFCVEAIEGNDRSAHV